MPDRITIPLSGLAEEIWFLHGCGFGWEHRRFGTYRVVFADDTFDEIPLIPYSHGPGREPDHDEWLNESTIQDWWPDFPILENSRVRPIPLTNRGDPYLYERYLYTYRWTNPKPSSPIAALVVNTNRDMHATLGLLSVTVLRPHSGCETGIRSAP